MIEILSSSALATVQDLGREGGLRWGVGTSGAMDPLALAAGNLLLGNEESAAGIEIPVFPFRVRFAEDCAFAVTGADCAATLDERPLMPWSTYAARAGQVLNLGMPQGGAWRAARAYLCLAGGVDVPRVLNSRSTQLRGAFGGLEGRALRKGDTLRAGAPGHATRATGIGLVPPALVLPLQVDGCAAMRVLPAAEYEGYTRNAIVQLRRVRQGTQIEEDHMRNRQMISRWLMANTKAIEVRSRGGKTYYVMTDPKAFREGVARLLAEVQRIKAQGDYPAARQLFETYGVHFDPKLRDEVVARVDKLNLPSYTGFVMPRLEPVKNGGGEIADVTISYPQDLTKQMLEYSALTRDLRAK